MSSTPPPASEPPRDESGGRKQLLEYWQVLVQRRWIVLASLAVVVGTTMVATLFAKPEYEATTTIQIDRQAPDILTFKDVVGTDQSYGAYEDFFQTQYKILQSRSVVRLAAERLDLSNHPAYAGRKATPLGRAWKWVRTSLSSPSEKASTADPLDPAIGYILGGLSIRPVRNSQLVQIVVADHSPELARDISIALAEAYVQFNFQKRYDTTAVAREFLTKEVLRVQSEISDLERKLQEYSTSKQLVTLQEGRENISEQGLSALNSSYVAAKAKLAIAEARYQSVRSASTDSLPEVLNSPLINNLRQQYAEIERQRTKMSEKFLPGWPALKETESAQEQARERLRLETEAIARQVRAAAKAEYEKARAEVSNLESEVATQKKEVQRVNRDTIEFASLKNEIDTRRKVLGDLVARQSQTQASERSQDAGTSNVRIVDKAELPKDPARPKKMVNLALALLLGTGLGIGMAFLLDYVDNAVKSEQDVLRISGLAVLGYVPRFRTLRAVEDGASAPGDPTPAAVDMASHTDPRSAFAEAFKNLRTSLLLASPDHPPRHIVVTSCEPQDGKSTISVNLAIVLAQLGRRVLVIDADLRRPRLHKAFGVTNDVGLSSVLSGNARAADLILETEIPGVMIACAGPIPPNPSELLGSPGLQTFLAYVDQNMSFDHVILDSPPVASVTDPLLLSSTLDATIVVVRAGKTSRDTLSHTFQRLRQARGRVAGVILNDMAEEAGYYYYGKHRYYGAQANEPQGREAAARTVANRFRRRHGRRAGGS